MEKYDISTSLYLKYKNKQRIGVILKTISWIDAYDDIQNLINNVLNFQSSEIGTYGLDLYGILLNFSRAIAIISTNYFGFQGSDFKPLSVAPFFRGVYEKADNMVMGNEYYKLLLQGLFLAAYFDGSLYYLNKIIQTIFSYRGKIAVVRNDNNSFKIVSDFALEDWEKLFFDKRIIPIPLGISYTFENV